MGAQESSTRRVSVDNDSTVQVSQAALARLAQAARAATPAPAPPHPAEQPRYDPQFSYESTAKRQQENAGEEAYWARRIENLRRAHDRINAGMQIEYEKALQQANELYKHSQDDTFAGKLPPCQQEKTKVLECYKENPNQTLVCSTVVSAFNNCVCNSRVAAVSAST